MDSTNQAYVYTDGSCNNKTRDAGGYGVVIIYKGEVFKISGGSYNETTSQRMELLAVIKALKKTKGLDCNVIIHSDSQYIVNSVNEGWLHRWEREDFIGRPNSGLWREFLLHYNEFDKGQVIMKWVRGHNGNHYNEMADELARKGAGSDKKIKDIFG